ncbi:hypothetical protein L3Y34_003346 [Caenorhabditis briggsae]|uniref:T-box domain-containing protein n=1 Tax=Caenorhabditis briggsae TaxID=6238 RepID=A0AAE9ACH0_CAEBR|nr:hypothetical protein L3Y34_003346 [Caenorhabditis briggsae]
MDTNFQMYQPSNAFYNPNQGVFGVHGEQHMPFYPLIQPEIRIKLKNQDQWMHLHKTKGGNEMIVGVHGRAMFPRIQFEATNLVWSKMYTFGMKMVLCKRKKFVYDKKTGWVCDENSEEMPIGESNEVYTLSKSGSYFMDFGIDFQHVKIYNEKTLNEISSKPSKVNKATSCEVYLNCKYIPVLTIYEEDCRTVIRQFQFEETQFVAVSAYKGEDVKDYKSSSNKFVRGGYRNRKGRREEEEASQAAPNDSSEAPGASPSSNLKRAGSPLNAPKKAKRSKKNKNELKGLQATGTPAPSGSTTNSMPSTSSEPIQNTFGSPQSLNGYHNLSGFDSTNTSISSNMPRTSLSPPINENRDPAVPSYNQMIQPQASALFGESQQYFGYGCDSANTSASSAINNLSMSPPMAFNANQDLSLMPPQVFQDPMINYSTPSTSNTNYMLDTNYFVNEATKFWNQMNEVEFKTAAPNPYQFNYHQNNYIAEISGFHDIEMVELHAARTAIKMAKKQKYTKIRILTGMTIVWDFIKNSANFAK